MECSSTATAGSVWRPGSRPSPMEDEGTVEQWHCFLRIRILGTHWQQRPYGYAALAAAVAACRLKVGIRGHPCKPCAAPRPFRGARARSSLTETTGNCSLAGPRVLILSMNLCNQPIEGLNLIGRPASQVRRRPGPAVAAPPARAPLAAGLERRPTRFLGNRFLRACRVPCKLLAQHWARAVRPAASRWRSGGGRSGSNDERPSWWSPGPSGALAPRGCHSHAMRCDPIGSSAAHRISHALRLTKRGC